MFFVGDVGVKARRLCDVTYEAMMRGIAAAKPGGHVGDIGHAIQTYVEAQRFSVVRDFSGHGLGRIFHDAPNILHYGKAGTGPVLKPGMFFTVEPMVNVGTWQVKILSDGWTAVTRDKQLSAQFEHSVGITETGVEFFTLSPKGLAKPPYDLGQAGRPRTAGRLGLSPANPAAFPPLLAERFGMGRGDEQRQRAEEPGRQTTRPCSPFWRRDCACRPPTASGG